MKAIHITSGDEFTSHRWWKYNGIDGMIVISHTHKVLFIYSGEMGIDYMDLSKEFEIIKI